MKTLTVAYLFFLLASLLVLGAASSAHNRTSFLKCLTIKLQSSNSHLIYTPNNASYSVLFQSKARNVRSVSTSRQRPLVILTPVHESQIQAAVRCSKKHGVLIRVRSGGHDYEGLSYVSGIPFVIIDLKNLVRITISTQDNTAWVQTGSTLGRLYHTIAQTSRTLAFSAGVCPTVGVGGHITGGGYGMLSRKYGLAADNTIDARVIDPNGRILDRNSMGEDLFWAIRGGGGPSFGIVIAFKVKLVPVPKTVTVFDVPRTLEQNATQLVEKWQHISDTIDENLLLRVFLRIVTSPSNNTDKIIQVSFTSLFLGPVDDLLSLMGEKFPELGLVKQDCTEMSWIESVLYFSSFRNGSSIDVLINATYPSAYFKGKSDYVRQPIPVNGLEGIWKFLNEEIENQAELQFSPYGGKLSTFSDNETPFPHRSGNIYMIEYTTFWFNSTESERHVSWVRKLYSYMAPYVSQSPRAAYFNYKDLDIGMNNQRNTSYRQARVWGFKYFKNNFDRLVHVKTKFDPSNLFRNEQSIPPL